MTETEGANAPSFCRTHGDYDDKSSGLKIVDRKSADLPPGTAVAIIQSPLRGLSSQLPRDVFGEGKMSVRTVLGVASLPQGLPVMLEVTFEVYN
jgi:hypothetical protein